MKRSYIPIPVYVDEALDANPASVRGWGDNREILYFLLGWVGCVVLREERRLMDEGERRTALEMLEDKLDHFTVKKV